MERTSDLRLLSAVLLLLTLCSATAHSSTCILRINEGEWYESTPLAFVSEDLQHGDDSAGANIDREELSRILAALYATNSRNADSSARVRPPGRSTNPLNAF